MAARQLVVGETAAAAGRTAGESKPWAMCGARTRVWCPARVRRHRFWYYRYYLSILDLVGTHSAMTRPS